MRDAASSLHRLSVSKRSVANETSDQLEAANRKVEATHRDLLRVYEKSTDVHRRLSEHRSAVLSHTVRDLEKAPDRGGDGANSIASNAFATADPSPILAPATLPPAPSTSSEVEELKDQLEEERHAWAREKEVIESRAKDDVARLQQDLLQSQLAGAASTKELSDELTSQMDQMGQTKSQWEEERLAWSREREKLQNNMNGEVAQLQQDLMQAHLAGTASAREVSDGLT